MRRLTVVILLVLGLIFSVSVAQAQFTGQLSTARTLPVGGYDLGGYFGVYEDAFAFFGQFRGGVVEYLDLGMKLGVISYDPSGLEGSGEGVILGGDLKYQILDAELKDPFDLSVGAGLEFFSTSHNDDNYNSFSFGANFCGSKDFALAKGRVISPYGRLNFRGQREPKDENRPWDRKETNFKPGLNPGVSLKVSNYVQIIGELQFDDNFGFIGGLTYSFY
ncbi:MAG: hypothetical protein Q8O10_06800 [candidate division Zixibacteria bacterium]|nr:hypothetical protein [candidate division Zixibacteria bacterium]